MRAAASSSASRRELARAVNTIFKTELHFCRGKSNVASVAPNASAFKPRRSNRLKMEERRAMVSSFVEKYRDLNSGRFPSITIVRKEVGGSHYTIRELLQELEYIHKTTMNLQSLEAAELNETKNCSSSGVRLPLRSTLHDTEVAESASEECCGLQGSKGIKSSYAREQKEGLIRSEAPEINVEEPDNCATSDSVASKEIYHDNFHKSISAESAPQKISGLSKPRASDFGEMSAEVSVFSESTFSGQRDEHPFQAPETTYSPTHLNASRHQEMRSDPEGTEQRERGKASKVEVNESGSLGTEDVRQRPAKVWDNLRSFAHGLMSFWKKI